MALLRGTDCWRLIEPLKLWSERALRRWVLPILLSEINLCFATLHSCQRSWCFARLPCLVTSSRPFLCSWLHGWKVIVPLDICLALRVEYVRLYSSIFQYICSLDEVTVTKQDRQLLALSPEGWKSETKMLAGLGSCSLACCGHFHHVVELTSCTLICSSMGTSQIGPG